MLKNRWVLSMILVGIILCTVAVLMKIYFTTDDTVKHVAEDVSVPWSDGKWKTSSPEEQGMDSNQLTNVIKSIQSANINMHSLLVIRNGYLVLDVYFEPYSKEILHPVHSVTKSFTSALTGIAIEEGLLKGIDQEITDFFPQSINSDAKKAAITIKDLLTMQTGMEWDEWRRLSHRTKYNSFTRMTSSPDAVRYWLSEPMNEKPGSRFNYNSGASHLISAIIQKASGKSMENYAKEKLFAPLNILDYTWNSSQQGVTWGGHGLNLTPEDMAKFGYLYLNNGKLNGTQIIPSKWVSDSTNTYINTNTGRLYGYQWWGKEEYYFASGSRGQNIFVSPDENLIAWGLIPRSLLRSNLDCTIMNT